MKKQTDLIDKCFFTAFLIMFPTDCEKKFS